MSHDNHGAGSEAGSPRSRPSGPRVHEGGVFAALDKLRPLRPLTLVAAATCCGLLLAPQLATPDFPTDANLVGTPATGNFKAPHDIEVVDEETTEHLRRAAVAEVRRVYDLDVRLGDKIAEGIETAFALIRPSVDAFLTDHPEVAEGRVPRSQEARYREALNQALATVLPEFEKAMGTSLRPEELEALFTLRYDPEIGKEIAHTIREALSQPVVATDATLDPDRSRGIAIQRVPDDGTPVRNIADLDTIASVDSVRRDLAARVRRLFPDSPPAVRELAAAIAARLIETNLTPSINASELARQVARLSVKPVTISVKKGEMVIRDGERLTRRHILIFQAIQEASGGTSIVLAALGAAAAVLILIGVGVSAATGRGHHLHLSARDLLALGSLFVAAVAAMRLWLVVVAALHERFATWPMAAFLFLAPIASVAMITRLVQRTDVGVWFGVLVALVLGLMVENEQPFAFYAAVGSTLGATLIGTVSARGDLLRAGVWVGLGQMAAAAALQLFAGHTEALPYSIAMGAAFIGGVLSGLVTLALTPVVEAVFGYTTDLKLLELANLNHPALKELIVQAPGSYHHSVIVGSLVEAAAEAIGANPLLARVMAYYHDIGKGCNPGYFIENQKAGSNPHDKLKPSMSAMIIRRHITDGLEIARRYRLGEPIQAAIAEHHGTTLIHFFHHRAKEMAGEDQTAVSESDYRYPGQRPQSREAALVMLGDSVEAAARSLADPTPARLQGVINRVINLKFTDEQLEECDITLKDLHIIARAFARVLNSIYHTRPEYPELLKDLTGSKKQNGDPDPKPPKKSKDLDLPPEDARPDNLRRLGLS